MFLVIWLCVLVAIGWLYFRKTFSYFKDREVNNVPTVPIFGNIAGPVLKREHFIDYITRPYVTFPEDRFVGNFDFIVPSVIVRDPELIRLITVKDFEHFTDHRMFTNDKDPFFSKSLFGLKGQKWRDMRSTLSPAFTGSKLRGMVPLVQDCSNNLIEYLKSEVKKNKNGYLDLDSKDLFSRYTNDVIATCAFGLQVNSIAESENHFYKMGRKLTNIKFIQMIKMFIVITIPFINKMVDLSIFSIEATTYLKNTFLRAMKNRAENNSFRPDVIQILLEAQKGTLSHENVKDEKDAGFATVEESTIGKGAIKQVWAEDELVAQALLFFFAGFDTVSTGMSFLLYELAKNPDCQTKLRQEIDECYEKYAGKVDYEKINQLKYMDMAISESLRKWSPAPSLDRVCQKTYNMGRPNEKATKDFHLEKGMTVFIPVWPIHYDPKYYPEPQKFDPERFSDENKHKIKPFTYMPFGVGPRNCIGSRFALTEMKIMAFDLVRQFEITPGPKTNLQGQMDLNNSFGMRLLGGDWLRFLPRST